CALDISSVVREDSERADPHRERLAQSDHTADDRQARERVALHRRLDRAVHLRDLAVGLADGDGPVRGAAHHHALEDGLSSNRSTHATTLAAAGGAGLLEPALE